MTVQCFKCKDHATHAWDIANDKKGWGTGSQLVNGAVAWCNNCNKQACDHYLSKGCSNIERAQWILDQVESYDTVEVVAKSEELEDSLDWFRSKLR